MRARMIAMSCVLLVAAGSAACGGDGPDSSEDDLTSSLKEGSAEALAVLAVANDPGVTSDVLKGAGVDSRAVTGIVAHRNGADGSPGTADDDAYDTVAELDAVKWVGATALKKLLT